MGSYINKYPFLNILIKNDRYMTDTTHLKEVYVENKLDYGKFILEPKIEEKYKEITKDFSTSNLDSFSIKIGELRNEIINILFLHAEWFQKSIESFERDQHIMLQINRSKYGFQAKLERANLSGETTDMKGFEKEKARTIFGGGK